jgi:hypothetical protein
MKQKLRIRNQGNNETKEAMLYENSTIARFSSVLWMNETAFELLQE